MNEDTSLVDLEKPVLVKLKPGESTLPIDTSAEWTRGYLMLDEIIRLLRDDIHVTEYTDDQGVRRSKHVIPDELLGYMRERRLLIKQIWKIAGGEAINEAKKENAKNVVNLIWQSQEPEIKKEHEEDVKKILEEDVNEES